MQYDVNALKLTATTQTNLGRTRIKTLWLVCSATAGNITIRDGSATGFIVVDIDTAALVDNAHISFPGEGVLCVGSPHVTLTNVTSTTIFYG